MRKLRERADEKQRRKALRRAREDESITDDLKAVDILERMADAIQADWSRTSGDMPKETLARDCRVCGGSGWTDGSAELRRDSNKGSTECIACKGSGKEVALT